MKRPEEVYNGNSLTLICRPNIKITLSLYSWPSSEIKMVCKAIDFTTFDAAYKINPADIMNFVNDLCLYFHHNYEVRSIRKETIINLQSHHLAVETIRDLYSGKIQTLLEDNVIPTTNHIVSFGYLGKKNSKPQREQYAALSEQSDYIDFINTERFSWMDEETSKFTSLIDLKRTYKYLFDLKGHTYSTKSYLFLASKRVFFSSAHPSTLWWEEKYLKPWVNYIPVKSDLSDLDEMYQKIESDPSLYGQIVTNNLELLQSQLSQRAVLKNLADEIFNYIDASEKHEADKSEVV